MRGAILAAAIAALLAGASVRAQTYEQQRDWCVNARALKLVCCCVS